MAVIPVGQIKITFNCEHCGPARVVLSDGYSDDDSVASCETCGAEFGRWGDVKLLAIREAIPIGRDMVAEIVRKALKG